MSRAVRALTPKEQRFVAAYLLDLNASKAYRVAFGAVKNADVMGPRLLVKAGIGQAVAEGKRRQLQRADLTAARVLEELRRLAFGDRTALLACQTVADVQALPEELRALVSDFEVFDANIKGLRDGKTDRVRRVRTYPKGQAVELLAKHFKLLTDVIELDVTDALFERLERGRERNAKREK